MINCNNSNRRFKKGSTFLKKVRFYFSHEDGNPVPRTVQMTFLQLIRLVHNESLIDLT